MRRLEGSFNRVHVVNRGAAKPDPQPVEEPIETVCGVPLYVTLIEANPARPNDMGEVREPVVVEKEGRVVKWEISRNGENELLTLSDVEAALPCLDRTNSEAYSGDQASVNLLRIS